MGSSSNLLPTSHQLQANYMPRVKRGKSHVKRRKNLLQQTKGYRWNRKNTIKAAHTAVKKAGVHAFMDRKKKKQVNRALWQIKINAACRQNGTTYSRFINALKVNNIELDRKVLADIAMYHPAVFTKIVSSVKS